MGRSSSCTGRATTWRTAGSPSRPRRSRRGRLPTRPIFRLQDLVKRGVSDKP